MRAKISNRVPLMEDKTGDFFRIAFGNSDWHFHLRDKNIKLHYWELKTISKIKSFSKKIMNCFMFSGHFGLVGNDFGYRFKSKYWILLSVLFSFFFFFWVKKINFYELFYGVVFSKNWDINSQKTDNVSIMSIGLLIYFQKTIRTLTVSFLKAI